MTDRETSRINCKNEYVNLIYLECILPAMSCSVHKEQLEMKHKTNSLSLKLDQAVETKFGSKCNKDPVLFKL